MSSGAPERRLAAILSADAVGYSRLMAEDEARTVATLQAYREQVSMLVRQHRGRLVDFTGDNFLAEFPTASGALECGLEIQRVMVARNAAMPPERRMDFRIGIHAGEVRVEGERIYGTGVNVAARLETLAPPSGVCISGVVLEQVRRQPGLAFRDLGPQHLKNLPDPVHAYAVDPATRPPRTVAVGSDAPSVAVLPFVNMSPDPDQEYFADGMAEELINALAQVPGLRVIARTSAFSFKGRHADVGEIGRRLDVATLVEGSVRKMGNRLRIAAQLIDVCGGHHLWSEVYDRSLDDVFEIQDEIARTIVRTIRPKLLGDEAGPLVVRPTESQAAYELYLRAGERLARFDRWDTRTAIEMLKDATALDPGYADAWARMAAAYAQIGFGFEPESDWRERAEEAVRRAFELDPDNADAHFAHGRMLWSPGAGFRHRDALCAFGRCLALQPGAGQPRLWRGMVLMHVGLLAEAREAFAEALASQADDPFSLNAAAQVALFQGDYDEARETIERSHHADPALWLTQVFRPSMWLYQGDLAGAEQLIQSARQRRLEEPMLDACEALLWAKRGERDRAEAALARAMRNRPSVAHDHHRWHYAAATHAVLGRPGEAVVQLRTAADTGLPNASVFREDPHLASLADDPGMRALLDELDRHERDIRAEFGRT